MLGTQSGCQFVTQSSPNTALHSAIKQIAKMSLEISDIDTFLKLREAEIGVHLRPVYDKMFKNMHICLKMNVICDLSSTLCAKVSLGKVCVYTHKSCLHKFMQNYYKFVYEEMRYLWRTVNY